MLPFITKYGTPLAPITKYRTPYVPRSYTQFITKYGTPLAPITKYRTPYVPRSYFHSLRNVELLLPLLLNMEHLMCQDHTLIHYEIWNPSCPYY